jgi:taspase (threonine aspartase 1)
MINLLHVSAFVPVLTANSACKAAMGILKSGGSALDAVEMAIIVMEDDEMTNAGYGSNLTIEGAVECDATIVDHHGRSGAAGAVSRKFSSFFSALRSLVLVLFIRLSAIPICLLLISWPTSEVKNPISLARMLLETSARPLTCHRVPPSFLVGEGATDFAYEQGLVILPPDGLISRFSKERWHRWLQDLEAAELVERKRDPARFRMEEDRASFLRRPMLARHPARLVDNTRLHPHVPNSPFTGVDLLNPLPRRQDPPSGQSTAPAPPTIAPNHGQGMGPASGQPMVATGGQNMAPAPEQGMAASTNTNPDGATSRGSPMRAPHVPVATSMDAHPGAADEDEDMITDTVGAIAVDCYGNIAAGSSSGGIGAKHRGRIGPAALVGIGTYVIPVDHSDPEQVSVASVTSGTGEHIATTMAAQTSAARLYYCQKKRKDGTFENVSEDEALNATIATEFMGEFLYSLSVTIIDREQIVYNLRRASRC